MIAPDPFNWHAEIAGWSDDILPFYARMATELPDNAQCVEVGVYKGRSVLFFADSMRDRPCVIHAVDTWDESDWASHRPDEAVYQEFVGHAQRLGLVPPLVIHRESSRDASARIVDASIDIVFIDAAHTYEGVRADIGLWLPKLKPGSVLSGHDYSGSFPGVSQAVEEAFADRVKVTGTVWEVRV